MNELLITSEPRSSQEGERPGKSSAETPYPCTTCRMRTLNICSVLLAHAPARKDRSDDWQLHACEKARRNIKSSGERTNRVHVLCDGWAFRFVQLPDGRRQILTILLPGDFITLTRPFDETIHFSVQAITNVRYCGYDRSVFKDRLTTDDVLMEAWSNQIVMETQRNFGFMIDLGCRSADERIAHLLLDLKLRLKQRGSVVDQAFWFPLSQKIIAEATGLTPEHVSRVLASFRLASLIYNKEGWLKITNLNGLQRIGGLNY